MARRFRHPWLLGVILALAAGLRLYGLGRASLWLDEGVSVQMARMHPAQIVRASIQDVHPPLYYLALHAWIGWFGDGERAIRLLSAIFSLAAVWFVYRLGRELYGRRTGLAASLIMALAPFQVHYAQEARSYALLLALALLSSLAFLRLLARPGKKHLAFYALATLPLLYTHNYGLLVLAAHHAYFLGIWFLERLTKVVPEFRGTGTASGIPNRSQSLKFSRAARFWILAQIPILLGYLPWIGALASQIGLVQRGFWLPRPGLRDLIYAMRAYGGSSPGALLLGVAALAALLRFKPVRGHSRKKDGSKLVAQPPSAVIETQKQSKSQPRAAVPQTTTQYYKCVEPLVQDVPPPENHFSGRRMLLWRIGLHEPRVASFLGALVLSLTLLPFLISRLLTPIYLDRATIPASACVYVLAAAGIARLRLPLARGAALGALALAFIPGLWTEYQGQVKERWRDVVADIEREAQPGDLVLVHMHYNVQTVYAYYARRKDLRVEPFPRGADAIDEQTIGQLDGLIARRDRVWLVLSRANDPRGLLIETLKRDFPRMRELEYSSRQGVIRAYLFTN